MENQLQLFGKNIKDLRVKRGYSQEKLAEIADFDRTYISLIERGKRNLSLINICRFAKALGVKPFQLIENLQ